MVYIERFASRMHTTFLRGVAHIASASLSMASPNVVTSVSLINVIAVAVAATTNAMCSDPLVKSLQGGLNAIISILTAVGVAVSVIGIMVGGLMRATSWGSEQRIATSNKAIISAITGLIIVLLAVVAGMSIPSWFSAAGSSCPVNPITPSATPAAA